MMFKTFAVLALVALVAAEGVEDAEDVALIAPEERVEDADDDPYDRKSGKGDSSSCTDECEVCCKAKTAQLTFKYTGTTDSDNQQGSKAWNSGTFPVGETATISASQYGFSQTVAVGGTFTISDGGGKLDAETTFTVCGANGSPCGTVDLHTSCSVPLILGNKFGPLTVIGFVDLYGNTEQGTQCNVQACYDDLSECPGPTPATPCEVCDAGKDVQSITFEIVGGPPAGEYSVQSGKGGSVGGTLPTNGPYNVNCQNAQVAAGAGENDFVTSSFQGNDIICQVSSGGQTQTINFHVSCSKELRTQQVFGAITLVAFVNANGQASSSLSQCAGRPAPPCELCCQLPPTITTPAVRRIVNKEMCVNDALPSSIKTQLQTWYDAQGGAQCQTNNVEGSIVWSASHTVSQIEQSLCVDADFCPDKNVTFTCCDPCNPEFVCRQTTASFEIGFKTQMEIDEQCVAPQPPVAPCDVCNGAKGKPTSLTFTITGGAPLGEYSLQSGKGGSTGATLSPGGSFVAQCSGGQGQMTSGNTFTVGGFSTNDIVCTISGGGGSQTVMFHVSCSKRLVTGDSFGAIRLDSFVNSAGGTLSGCSAAWPQGYNGYGDMPLTTVGPAPDCDLCCVMMPDAVFPPTVEFPKIERCTVDNKLPAETKAAIQEWLDVKSCTTVDGSNGAEYARVSYNNDQVADFTDITVDDIEELLCATEGNNPDFPKCPFMDIDFACCDPCRYAPGDALLPPWDKTDSHIGDLCVTGDATVAIVDNEKPVIDVEDKGVRCSTEPGFNQNQYTDWLKSAMCSDAQSPNTSPWNIQTEYLTRRVTKTGEGTCLQTTQVTYNCNDECMNPADEHVVSFVINDNLKPEVLTPAVPLEIDCDMSAHDIQQTIDMWETTKGGATVSDCSNYTGVCTKGPPAGTCPMVRDVNFRFTDACDNFVDVPSTITMVDNKPPVITCDAAVTNPGIYNIGCQDVTEIECDAFSEDTIKAWLKMNAGLVCTDSCSELIEWQTPTLVSTAHVNTCDQAFVYEFTCSDPCGNEAKVQKTVRVVDTMAPMIVEFPASTTVECDGEGNGADLQAWLNRWGSTDGVRWADDTCHPNPPCDGPGYRMDKVSSYCEYCSDNSDPVCSDGQTFKNPCYAYCSGKQGYMQGPCAYVVTTTEATTTDEPETAYDGGGGVTYGGGDNPACGYCSDEKTPVCVGGTHEFDNFCFAYCNNHWHFAVGPCQKYQTAAPPSCTDSCGDYVSQVCGSDHVTYQSPCLATCANVYDYKPGPCNADCGINPLTYTYTQVGQNGQGDCTRTGYTFIATDPCGHATNSPVAEFVVEDSTPPVIHPESLDATVECDGNGNLQEFQTWVQARGGAACSDTCAGSDAEWAPQPAMVGGGFVMNGQQGVCGTDCVHDRCITMMWTCMDTCGHATETTAKFIIIDTTPPLLTVNPIIVEECGEVYVNQATKWASRPLTAVIDAMDSCDYCKVGDTNPAVCDWSKQPKVVANLRGGQSRGTPFWRQEDGFYVDPPKIPHTGVVGVPPSHLTAADLQYLQDNTYELNFGDACPLISIMEIGAADACGNEAPGQTAFHIYTDTTPPEWTTPPQDMEVECDRTGASDAQFHDWLVANANAVCDDSCAAFDQTAITYDPPSDNGEGCPATKDVTFHCTDMCGNTISATATFSVVDTLPPVIPSVPDKTVECGPNNPKRYDNWVASLDGTVDAVDQCTRMNKMTYDIEAGPLGPRDGTPAGCSDVWGRVTVTATDECGNSDTTRARFFATDTMPPMFTNDGFNLTYVCDDSCDNRNTNARYLFSKWSNGAYACLEAEDCQEDMSFSIINGPGNNEDLCGTSGTIKVVVTDACGNRVDREMSYNFPINQPPPPPPPQTCEICSRENKVKISMLVMEWNSPTGAAGVVSVYDVTSAQTVPSGGTITIDNGGYKLPTNAYFTVSGSSSTLHTSCSQPINVGQVLTFNGGTLTIVGFRRLDGQTESSCNGGGGVGGGGGGVTNGPQCDVDVEAIDVCSCIPAPAPPPPLVDVCDTGKPSQLTFQYVGGNQLTNRQLKSGEAKASVSGGIPTVTASSIVCVGKSGSKGGGALQTQSNVAIGDSFVVGDGFYKMGSELTCTVTAGGAVQTIEVHTSCSMPLNVGDIFGSLLLTCFKTENGGTCQEAPTTGVGKCPSTPTPPPNVPPSGDDCYACGGTNAYRSKSRPTVLTLRYIGGYALTNLQEGKASVVPATAATGPAMISCTGMGTVQVDINGEFTLGRAGSQLGAETTCSVSSNSGTQVVDLHTSCSKDLKIGDIFGSITLIAFSRADGLFGAESAQCPATVAGDGDGDDNNGDDGDDNNGDDDTCVHYSPCDALDENGGLFTSITFRFDLGNAATFDHQQGNFGMQQTYTGSGRTRVKVGGRVKKTRYLSDGDVFRIHTSDHGINKLPGALSFLIGKGQTKSRIKFQVNCKRDIRVGDVFGVLEVVGFSTSRDSCETEQIASLGSTSADTSSSSGSSSSGGASAGLIAGVVVAALAVVVVGSVIAYHYTKAAPNPSTANANVQYNDNDENILARTKTGEEENGN